MQSVYKVNINNGKYKFIMLSKFQKYLIKGFFFFLLSTIALFLVLGKKYFGSSYIFLKSILFFYFMGLSNLLRSINLLTSPSKQFFCTEKLKFLFLSLIYFLEVKFNSGGSSNKLIFFMIGVEGHLDIFYSFLFLL